MIIFKFIALPVYLDTGNLSSLIVTRFCIFVFFKLIILFVYYLITKKFDIHLLSLNPITVLVVLIISYLYFYLIVNAYIDTILFFCYNKIYDSISYLSYSVDQFIKSYKQDINYFIVQCEKVLFSHPIVRKLLTIVFTMNKDLSLENSRAFPIEYKSFKIAHND